MGAPGKTKVILKCLVQLGRAKEEGLTYKPTPDKAFNMNNMFRHLQNHQDGPFDSVILDRSARKGKPKSFPVPAPPIHGTRIEAVNVGDMLHPGYEFVVYSWDQVRVVEVVKEDPIPFGMTKKDGK